MSFISPEFVLFFGAGVFCYWLTPARWRWLCLLVLSYLFYATWHLPHLLVIVGSTLVNFYGAQRLATAQDSRTRTLIAAACIAFNLFLLFVFKYLSAALNLQVLAILLPIGISYFTFQQIAYIIDVNRGKVVPETRLSAYANFVAFFPLIPAGPIERANNLLPQLRQWVGFNEANAVEGLRLLLWGLFKKVVIANRLLVYVKAVYDQPQQFSGLPLLIATVLFAFQLYCDFSGYSDMALGLAKMMGIRLTVNFRQPYLARSIQEFWQRWHISLSNWIRDYLFFPLTRLSLKTTGNRFAVPIRFVVYLIIMGLVGLWHGPSLTYIVWGLLHGFLLGLESLLNWQRIASSGRVSVWLETTFKRIITFSLVCVGWVFFRANSLADAWYILTHSFSGDLLRTSGVLAPFGANANSDAVVALVLILLLLLVDILDVRWGVQQLLQRTGTPVRWAIYYAFIFGALLLGVWSAPEFIYFKF